MSPVTSPARVMSSSDITLASRSAEPWRSSCASSSPEHRAGSVRPSSPSCSTAGHEVVGLARSDAVGRRGRRLGAEVLRGDLDDLDSLRAGAAGSDGVVHLGYNHDFSRMEAAAQTDLQAIDAIGTALEGTDRPLVIASGTLGLAPGRVGTEQDLPDPDAHPRIANARPQPCRSPIGACARSIVRFAPTVHGAGDHGFVAILVAIAREKGVSGYVDDGANRWPAVHRLDAGEPGPSRRRERTGRLGAARGRRGGRADPRHRRGDRPRARPTGRLRPGRRGRRPLRLARALLRRRRPASNTLTRELLGWEPTHPGLIADLDQGHYFRTPTT